MWVGISISVVWVVLFVLVTIYDSVGFIWQRGIGAYLRTTTGRAWLVFAAGVASAILVYKGHTDRPSARDVGGLIRDSLYMCLRLLNWRTVTSDWVACCYTCRMAIGNVSAYYCCMENGARNGTVMVPPCIFTVLVILQSNCNNINKTIHI